MDRKYFQRTLQKYLQGTASPEEERTIDSWYSEMDREHDPTLENEDEPTLEKKYWSAIESHIRERRKRFLMPWTPISIAASLLIVVVTGLYLRSPEKPHDRLLVDTGEDMSEWRVVENEGETSQEFTLSDGSRVTLEAQSHLKFPSAFKNGHRTVYLEGEAFFNISRDENRPFFVYTHRLKTSVLGTSFRIRAFEKDKRVTVAVKTGKVSVSKRQAVKRDEDEDRMPVIVLTPNQQVVFDKTANKLSRTIVAEPVPILPAEEVRRMRFEAAPVSEIFMAIEKVYGVDITFDLEKFSACRLTSVISDGGLYNRLDIICKAIGATYALRENQIVITGAGCDYQ